MAKLRVGIIGTGFVGPAHIEAALRTGLADVVAVVGSSEEKARAVADRYGIPRAYGDYHQLLADADVDVVHNCTPNHLHFPMNRDVLRAGKHLLSEKPLGISSAETGQLLQLAREAGVVHGVCFNYRHYAMVQELRQRVLRGDLGEVRIIRGHYLQDWLLWETDYNWRVDPALGGPLRAVADIGSHWLDTVQFISGQRVTRVFADLATLLPVRRRPAAGSRETFTSAADTAGEPVRVESEDAATLLLRFDGGAIGSVTVSQVSAGRKNRLVVALDGSRAAAEWSQEESERLWLGYRDKPNEVLLADPALVSDAARSALHYPGGHNQGWPDGLKNLLMAFYSAVRDGARGDAVRPYGFATFDDGHRMQRILDAVRLSHERAAWVAIDDDNL